MIAEIVLIPDGMGLDAAKSSAQYIARGLVSIGMKVREHISVCPDSKQFQQAVAVALGRSNVLVVLGGMGPESGYMGKTVLSRGLGLPLEEHKEAISGIREYCKRTGDQFLREEDSALAMLPRGSAAFAGAHGKLPGCAISSSKQHIILLPEVPAEIPQMFNKHVSPYLGGAENATVTRTLRTYGLREEAVRGLLGELLNTANPSVTLQKDVNEVLVRVSSYAATQQQAAALCTPMLRTLAEKLGDYAYGLDVDSLQSAVIGKLERRQLDLAVAEAGTGGNLTRSLTETPGGQDILRYSVAVDDSENKTEKLGVNKKTLKKEGNISEYAAVACASAAREKANTWFGVAVLANTNGEKSRACPAGTVYIAVADAGNVFVKKLVVGNGEADPDLVADAALSRALNMLRLAADYHPEPYSAAIPLDEALAGLRVTEQPENEEEYGETKKRRFGKKSDGSKGFSIRKLVIIAASLMLVASACYIGYNFYTGYIARKQASELQNMFLFGDMSNVEVSPDFPRGYSYRFAGLWNVNPDIKAFISIPDAAVNYPVVQAADNDYYLRRDFYAESNRYGVPYLDYRADVKKPSDNLVVYGHNMRDGQLFGELIKYREPGYYREHPVIDFSTVYEDKSYKIFSVFITNAYENQGEVFNYHDFIDFESEEQETGYLRELVTRSLINTGVDVQNGDELLTLSTCTYEFEDARLVVVGRALRRGESAEVDTSAAKPNPSPLMPDVWYKLFGGEKPTAAMLMRIASTSLVNLNEEQEPAEEKPEPNLEPDSPPAQPDLAAEEGWRRIQQQAEAWRAYEALAAQATAAEEARLQAEQKERERLAQAEEKARQEAEEKAKLAEQERLAKEAEEKAAEDARRLAEAEEIERQAREEKEKAEQAAREAQAKKDREEIAAKRKARANGDAVAISVYGGGKTYRNQEPFEIVARVVQNEIGSTFSVEAIKAQAVAAYTFIRQANEAGSTPTVIMASTVSQRVQDAVAEVLGETLYYGNSIAFTPYHAISCGSTTASADVWGGHYPYLVAVESEVCKSAPYYAVETKISSVRAESLIKSRLGITVDGNPESWFEILNKNDGYNGEMSVCGHTKSRLTGSVITGRLLRETVFNLRSASFEVEYDNRNDCFIFTTYGYGHGVGLSQQGANLLAQDGWSYTEILAHYYPGTQIDY